MKISVVICVADDMRIQQMLSSIYTHCEVVVVLNGATSQVKKIVQSFKKNETFELKVITLKEHNLSKARNVGIMQAKYDKVVFYDSDCIMLPGSLESYNKYLNKYLLVDGKVKFKSDFYQSKIVSIIRSMGIPGYALCPSIGINKKILSKIKYFFDEDIKWIEDSELNSRCKQKKIKVGQIESLTCIHDNLTFKQDLKSAFRYGTGVKLAAKKGLHKKSPTANWNLIVPCFKEKFGAGLYCIVWNMVYCVGYYFT